MGKKNQKKRNAGPPKPVIQLSQCMIVKNEEKNIERALSWAKGLAFEQIVVDTGSTDRTVEIAERMGAKVYYFEWINDFSAAKNYAIEQATGNWIAFLDADEYFPREDAKRLLTILKKIHSDTKLREQYHLINCRMLQLDDDGKVTGVDEHNRVFRNIPPMRYSGKIHEAIRCNRENALWADNISIYHTGYSVSVYAETDKAERNISMLRAELIDRPENLSLKANLAESLRGKARKDGGVDGAASLAEAIALYKEVADSDGIIEPWLRKRAHLCTIEHSISSGVSLDECKAMCLRALALAPEDLDYGYFYALVLNRSGDFSTAWDVLQKCEKKYVKLTALHESQYVTTNIGSFFKELLIAAEGLGNFEGVVKYATILLIENKTLHGILGSYIVTLLKHETPEDDVIKLLAKIYDFNDPQDVLLIARTAKECGALSIAKKTAEIIKKMIAD